MFFVLNQDSVSYFLMSVAFRRLCMTRQGRYRLSGDGETPLMALEALGVKYRHVGFLKSFEGL